MAKVHGSVSAALAEVELALVSESLAQMARASSHAGLDPESKGQPTHVPGLGSTTPRVSAPAGRDSGSAAPHPELVWLQPGFDSRTGSFARNSHPARVLGPRFVAQGDASQVDVEMAAYVGNIVGLGQAPKLSLDSTFYTPSDLVVNNSPAGSRVSAMHDGAPYTGHSSHSSHPELSSGSRGQLTPNSGLGPKVASSYFSNFSGETMQLYSVNNQSTTAVTLMALGGLTSQYSLSTVGVGVGSGGTASMMGGAGISITAEELLALGAAGAETVVFGGVGAMVYLSYKDAQWKSQEITRLAAVKDCGKASTASDRMKAFALVPYDDSPSEYTRDILARKFACEASTDFVDSLNAAPTPTIGAPSNTSRGAPFRPSDESDFGRFYMQQLQSNPSAAADPVHLGPQILSTPMPGNRGPQIFSTPLPEFAKPTILVTPDDRDRLAGLFDLPGYKPTDIGHDTLQESFPIHDHDWKDSVLLKDYEIDHWDVKPLSVGAAPEVYAHGKFGKIYQDGVQKVGNKEIWYSKDTAKHSGASQGLSPSTYKLFVKTKIEFEWIADVDATGKVIEGKHKGKTGKDIKTKDCWKVK
jgi:hypothetical protein